MKKISAVLTLIVAATLAAQAQLVPGNLAILRVGDGVQTLGNTGNTLYLDQFTAAGAFVTSNAIPDTGASAFIIGGTATSEGALARSSDKRFLAIGAYSTNRPYSASLSASTASAVPRAVGYVDVSGGFTLAVKTSTKYSGNNFRGAATDNGNNFWGAGGSDGTYYFGTASAAASVQSTVINSRAIKIYNGDLYFSVGSGSSSSRGIYKIAGTPSTATTPSLLFSSAVGTAQPFQFVLNAAGNVFYVADDNTTAAGGIQRWTNNAGTWTLQYTLGTGVASIGARGLAVDFSGANPVVYATTAEATANRLIKIVDTGAGSSATTLATARANTLFRGLDFTPEAAPSIVTAPQPQTVTEGTTATFSVVASGSVTLSYQWQKNGVDIPGATATTLTLTSVQLSDSGNLYRVVVTNPIGSIQSSAATLTVNAAAVGPSITTPPADQTVLVGGTATFSVVASGTQPLTYQWQKGGTDIPGATSSTLVLSSVGLADSGSTYRVVVGNVVNSVTSAPATLTVSPILPAIVTQPSGGPVLLGGTKTLTVVATGNPSPTYQWQKNGSNISDSGNFTGTATSTLQINNFQAQDAGDFRVIVSNLAGSVQSQIATVTLSPFSGFTNKGLVGVGRISADTFDASGFNFDTLGGVFSSLQFDLSSWSRSGDVGSGYTYHGRLFASPDRGYNNGLTDYHPRIQIFDVSITPYYGASATTQGQISLANTNSVLLTDGTGAFFTGYDADDSSATIVPRSTTTGRRSLDPEGMVRLPDGSYYLGEEYGPFIYRFDSSGVLQAALPVPAAVIPKATGSYPRTTSFTALNPPSSGRFDNRGWEGLTMSPDGTRLFAMLQSPVFQDGNSKPGSINTRILVYDVASGSPSYEQLIGEYIYQLTLNGNEAHTKNTPISEIHALNNHQLLVLERDARGLAGDAGALLYKKVNLADLNGATSILGTGYDLELGAPGQLSLPITSLPSGVSPVSRFDFVDLLDTAELTKFGLNVNSSIQDQNTLSEKWEGLGIVPLNDPATPNDYLLLVGNDNDFLAANTYHNGALVGQNALVVDTMLLAYRVTLPVASSPLIANSQSISTPQNTPVAIGLTASSAGVVYTITTPPAHGTLSGSLPNLTYTPSPSYVGSDTFAFNVNDGLNVSFPAGVTVTIQDTIVPTVTSVHIASSNPGPAYAKLADQITLSIVASEPIAAPTITIAGSSATVTGSGTTWSGTVGVLPVTAEGLANFIVEGLQDLAGNSGVNVSTTTDGSSVIVDKTAPSLNLPAPIVVGSTGASGAIVNYSVTATDAIDPNPSISSAPASGSLFVRGATQVNVAASDAAGNLGSGAFTVTVLNHEPVATPQTLTSPQDTTLPITLAASDFEGDSLTFQVATLPVHGALSGSAPSLIYTPEPGFTGDDSFTFTANDGIVISAPATVNLTVTSITPPPGETTLTDDAPFLPPWGMALFAGLLFVTGRKFLGLQSGFHRSH